MLFINDRNTHRKDMDKKLNKDAYNILEDVIKVELNRGIKDNTKGYYLYEKIIDKNIYLVIKEDIQEIASFLRDKGYKCNVTDDDPLLRAMYIFSRDENEVEKVKLIMNISW